MSINLEYQLKYITFSALKEIYKILAQMKEVQNNQSKRMHPDHSLDNLNNILNKLENL